MIEDIRGLLCDMGYEDAIVFDNPEFDPAIVGVTEDGRVVYDYEKMVAHLMEKDEIEAIDAIEFIDYNTIRALPYAGENAPVIMYPLIYGQEVPSEDRDLYPPGERERHPQSGAGQGAGSAGSDGTPAD